MIIAKFASEKECKTVLKKKATLRGKDSYNKVYIELERTRQERDNLFNLCSIVKAVGNDKIQLRCSRIVPRLQGENRNYAQAVSGQGQGRGGGLGGSHPGGNTHGGQGNRGSRNTRP